MIANRCPACGRVGDPGSLCRYCGEALPIRTKARRPALLTGAMFAAWIVAAIAASELWMAT